MSITTCAMCGKLKECPLRRAEMRGYVCLTCVNERLNNCTCSSYGDKNRDVKG
jgi:hypothetical protein